MRAKMVGSPPLYGHALISRNNAMRKTLLAIAAFAAATTALAAEYTIDNLEELREFMEAVHVEDFAGDTITLTADIDC